MRLDGWVVYNGGVPVLFMGHRPTKENGTLWVSPSGPTGKLAPQHFPMERYSTPQYVCVATGRDALVEKEKQEKETER